MNDREELYRKWVAWVTTSLGRDTRLVQIAATAATDAAELGRGFNTAAEAARITWADAAKRYSNDHRWWWDGERWTPASQALTALAPGAPPAGPIIASGHLAAPPQEKRHGLRNAGVGVLGCIGLAVIGILGLAAVGTWLGGGTSGSGAHPTPCSPKPCASADGIVVTFSGLNIDAPSGAHVLPKGYHLVIVEMTVLNGSRDTRRVSPYDFKLHDAAGWLDAVAFSDAPSCNAWPAMDVVEDGLFGPKPLCFDAHDDPSDLLSLEWSPGGSSAQPVNIVLRGFCLGPCD
jgi:hypothetical protein